ncbi:MAG: hypothetical protein JKY96_00880 [Phycisphaerales bacterium]|nr:hypothetical protein [Phycisphaerales bacterium]
MKPILFILGFLLFIVLPSPMAMAQTAEPTAQSAVAQGLALLDEANLLAESDPESALPIYRYAAATLDHARTTHNLHNAQLNQALGNAHLKSGQLGHAILAYRRAVMLDPTNTEARESLARARALVQTKAPPSRTNRVVDWLLAWRGHLPRTTIWALGTASFVGAWILLSTRIWRPTRLVTPAACALILFSLVAFSSAQLDAYQTRSLRHAVVVSQSITARTGPSSQIFDPAFQSPLQAGIECVVVDQRDGWSHIQLASNALGWVPDESIVMVLSD